MVMKERDDLKTKCDNIYIEKKDISQQLEENTIGLRMQLSPVMQKFTIGKRIGKI